MAKSLGWSTKLARPIGVKDGTMLGTLADVRAFVLNEPDYIQARQSWQRAVELLMEAAEDVGKMDAAEGQTKSLPEGPGGSNGNRCRRICYRHCGDKMELARPIGVKGGRKLETLADVRDFILEEPDYIQTRQSWQRARRSC